MQELLQKQEQFVNPPELVNQEATWAYLHSHKQREMNFVDQDYEFINLGANQPVSSSQSANLKSSQQQALQQGTFKKEPINRFSSIIDSEDPKFEKQRHQNLMNNINQVSTICEASKASQSAFYHRKIESLDSILASQHESRDHYIPKANIREFDSQVHLDMAQAPWPFLSMPGTKSSNWPQGLPEFLERLQSMDFWSEPLDILPYGIEFTEGAKNFIIQKIWLIKKLNIDITNESQIQLECSEISMALSAFIGFSVRRKSSDGLIEGLSLLSKVQSELQNEFIEIILQNMKESMKQNLSIIQDQFMRRNNLRYLDTSQTSGVFSVGKFISFAQQTEQNTSIATDGEYLYMYMSIPQKAMMYKIGTGSSEKTIAGKIYVEKKSEKDGDVAWTYCDGKLFSRRVNEEFGLITLYDTDTLNSLGEAKFLCGDIFSSVNCQQFNRYYPILSDEKSIYIVTVKIVQKRKDLKPEMKVQYQLIQDEKKKKQSDKTAQESIDQKQLSEALFESVQNIEQKINQIVIDPPVIFQKSEKDIQIDKKREIERKFIEMQAREEELMRNRNAARGRDRGRSARRGGNREYVPRGGGRPQPEIRRGAMPEEELKLSTAVKDINEDISAFKVCQFYLHEFKIDQIQSKEAAKHIYNKKNIEDINEIQQAFNGFFEENDFDMVFRQQDQDICEIAYNLANDAGEDRFKLTLPLSKSVLLCESIVMSESSGKKGGECDIQVAEDSILTPSSIQNGKWILNANSLSYHKNLMQENSLIHIFSIDEKDEKPINLKELQQKSFDNQDYLQLLEPSGLFHNQPPSNQKGLFESVPMSAIQDPSGLFDFKNSELERNNEFFKKMIMNCDDYDEFGDAQMDHISQMAKEYKQMQMELKRSTEAISKTILNEKEEVDEKEMFEEIKLYGTLQSTQKNQESLHSSYKAAVTYDCHYKKYYALVLTNQQRHIAVISDLQRFNEHFNIYDDPKFKNEDLKIQEIMDVQLNEYQSIEEVQIAFLKILNKVEHERFNMPWRWNQWSNLYTQAICYKQNQEPSQTENSLNPAQALLKKNEIDNSEAQKDSSQKNDNQQKLKQLKKLENKLLKVQFAEADLIRKEYDFEFDQNQKLNIQVIDKQNQNKEQPKKQGQKNETSIIEESQALNEIAKQNLKSIYERAKSYFGKGEQMPEIIENQQIFGQIPISQPKLSRTDAAQNFPIIQQFQAPSQNPFSLAKFYAESQKYSLPIEKIFVLREWKKIHMFCQSGNIKSLNDLYQMLLLVNEQLKQSKEKNYNLEQLKEYLLRHILVWSTFADQIASAQQKNYKLLDQIFNYIVNEIKLIGNRKDQEENHFLKIYWRILFVGWDYFCRSSSQQIEVITLALIHSEQDQQSIDNPVACKQKEESPKNFNLIKKTADKSAILLQKNKKKEIKRSQSPYELMLNVDKKYQILPIELFYSRFFRYHQSFYDIELLNKSYIKPYIVVLDQDAFKNVHSSNILSAQNQQEPQEYENKIFIVRKSLQDKSLNQIFEHFKSLPVSVKAVPTQFKPIVKVGEKGPNQSKNAKKHNKASKQIEQDDFKSGFYLSEVSIQFFNKSRSQNIFSARNSKFTSKMFSMNLGLTLNTNSNVALGIYSKLMNNQKENNQLMDQIILIEQAIQMLDNQALKGLDLNDEDLHQTRNNLFALFQKVQVNHSQKANDLIELFVNKIEASFVSEEFNLNNNQDNKKEDVQDIQNEKIINERNFLVKSFVHLAQRSLAHNFSFKSLIDISLIEKVIKLLERLLDKEMKLFDQKKIKHIRIVSLIPLINFVIETVSMSILNDPQNAPIVGYRLLPGLCFLIAFIRIQLFDVPKDISDAQASTTQKRFLNLMTSLQALTNEGIDFTREKIFETQHPYPQNDYTHSETIEVPRAIGFIVELDKRCSSEHSTDQLVMYSGSDHIYQINQGFATQIKFSQKPNTKQPYFLLGNKMKLDFRSYSQRQRRGQGQTAITQIIQGSGGNQGSQRPGDKQNQINEARWGYRVTVRPIFSEPQNIILHGHLRSSQRLQIYQKLGGEQSCNLLEITLNSLVCLASSFSKDIASIENFIHVKNQSSQENLLLNSELTSIQSSKLYKLCRQQLFRGGLQNLKQLMIIDDKDDQRQIEKMNQQSGQNNQLNYHDIINYELSLKNRLVKLQHKSLMDNIFPLNVSNQSEIIDKKQQEATRSDMIDQLSKKMNLQNQQFFPQLSQWTQKVKELIQIETLQSDNDSSSQIQSAAKILNENPQIKSFKTLYSPIVDKCYLKIRELVSWPIGVKQRFLAPSAKKYMSQWIELEKLLIVCLLYHSQSIQQIQKFVDVKIPNLKSSGGVFQYGMGLKLGSMNEDNLFLIEQLKLVGNQLNELLSWLVQRVQGEILSQDLVLSLLDLSQNFIDQRIQKKILDDKQQLEEELKQESLRLEKQNQLIEAEILIQKELLKKEEEKQKDSLKNSGQEEQKIEENKQKAPSSSAAVVVVANKNRKIKRGKIVRSVIDVSKAKKVVKKDNTKKQNESKNEFEKKQEDNQNKKEEDKKDEKPQLFADLTLTQINELKNQIEQEFYKEINSRFLGMGADSSSIKPICILYNIKFNQDDPIETVRLIFKKIKGRVSNLINLDDTENPKLLINLNKRKYNECIIQNDYQQLLNLENPYIEVCKDVRNRLLFLLEIKPSVQYLNNVCNIESGKCFSRYGSIQLSQLGVNIINEQQNQSILKSQKQSQKNIAEVNNDKQQNEFEAENENSQHDDELNDKLDQLDDDDEKLVPLNVLRSKSQQVGIGKALKIQKPNMQKMQSLVPYNESQTDQIQSMQENQAMNNQIGNKNEDCQNSQIDWLEMHRKWKQWSSFHKHLGISSEDKDLMSPFCSPLHSVLSFAKNSDIQAVQDIRQMLSEQQKRAAFRLFALKHQSLLYDVLQGTPYQRFLWGNQSSSLRNSPLDKIEASGEALVNKINQRAKKMVTQLMSYIAEQAESMKHYQDILEKFLKQQDHKQISSSSSTQQSGANGHSKVQQSSSQKSESQQKYIKSRKSQRKSPKNEQQEQQSHSNNKNLQQQHSQNPQEFQDRRAQKITFEDFVPWQMKTVMHSLNDLRVILSDPFTQVFVLKALKEDQSSFLPFNNFQEKLINTEHNYEQNQNAFSPSKAQQNLEINKGHQKQVEADQKDIFGVQNIKQFLRALIQIILQSHLSSPFAEQYPNSQKLCQATFIQAKIVLSLFLSDKQQIRETETSKILQEIMLEILVTHLEKACGFKINDQQNEQNKKQIENSVIKTEPDVNKDFEQKNIVQKKDQNIEDIVQLLKLLQEVMTISSNTQNALNRHSQIINQFNQSSYRRHTSKEQNQNEIGRISQFLSEGSTQVMRCAKLLSYLMIEYEVPVVVRHSVRCAKLFFFRLVNFNNLHLFSQKGQGSKEDGLKSSCSNQFILATLQKIGQRITNYKDEDQNTLQTAQIACIDSNQKQVDEVVQNKSEQKLEEQKIDETQESKENELKIGKQVQIEKVKESSGDAKYVVYANINSLNEDYTFLVTALYHWEKLYPVISQFQNSQDPKQFIQKSKKKEKQQQEKSKVQKVENQPQVPAQKVEQAQQNADEKKVEPIKQNIVAEEIIEVKEKLSEQIIQEQLQAEILIQNEMKKIEEEENKFLEMWKKESEKKEQEEVQKQEEVKKQDDVIIQKEPIQSQEILIQEQQAEKQEQIQEGIKVQEQKVEKLEENKEEIKAQNDQAEKPELKEEEQKGKEKNDDPRLIIVDLDKFKKEPTEQELKIQEALKIVFQLQKQAEKIKEEVQYLEEGQDLYKLYESQQKALYDTLISELINGNSSQLGSSIFGQVKQINKKDPVSLKEHINLLKEFQAKAFGNSSEKMANFEAIKAIKDQSIFGKQIIEQQVNVQLQNQQIPSNISGKLNIQSLVKGTIMGGSSGNHVQEINLIQNKIYLLPSQSTQQSQTSVSHALNQKLTINTLQTAFMDIIKETSEVIEDDDSKEEQTRKLNSRYFNERIMHHIFQAMCISNQLHSRYSVPITEPLDFQQAQKFAKILQQSYKEELEPVPLNPYLKEEFHHKKIAEGKKISQYFPFTLKNVTSGLKQPELPPGHSPPVVICQKTLVTSLITEKLSKEIEKIIEGKSHYLKALEKHPADGFRLNISKQNFKRQGQSISCCILSLIQFLQEILVGGSNIQNEKEQLIKMASGVDQKSNGGMYFNDVISQKSSNAAFSESNYNQNISMHEFKDQNQTISLIKHHEMRQEEIMKVIDQSLQLIKTKKWKEIGAEDKQIVLGLFAVVGGWYGFSKIYQGSKVQVQINEQWTKATVVDEGVGKRKISVILDEDSSLQLWKVSHNKVRPLQISIDKGINEKLNFDDLCEAITFLHSQMQSLSQKNQNQLSNSQEENAFFDEQMMSETIIFQMLLNVCSKLSWNKIDQTSDNFNKFRKILIQVTNQSSQQDGQTHEDKTKEYLEKQLIESWERTIDKSELKNQEFYCPREFISDDNSPKNESKAQLNDEEFVKILQQQEKQNQNISFYIDTDYVQPMSSYLNGLPEPVIKKNQKSASLKLLFYWEKYVLPTTREFVRSTFQKWEMDYYFEQIRHHLRQGDQRSAIQDSMILWENKIPNGVILPSENTDWTAKVADECIVDTWALAKINFSKQTQFNSSSQNYSSSSSQSKNQICSSEVTLPLLLKLQDLGVQAIVIQIKLIDSRYNTVLGEYYDPENFQSHFIWFPISHLFDLDYPLPPRSIGLSKKSVVNDYLQSINNINSLYARKTLIKFFSSQNISASRDDQIISDSNKTLTASEQSSLIFKQEEMGELKLQDLISWSIQEEYCNNPFNGWLQDLNCALPVNSSLIKSNQNSQSKKQISIQSLIEETSDKIIIEKLIQKDESLNGSQDDKKQAVNQDENSHLNNNPLSMIKTLLKNAVTSICEQQNKDLKEIKESKSYKLIRDLSDWCLENWMIMSEQVSANKAIFDLCKQNKTQSNRNKSQLTDNLLISLHQVASDSKAISKQSIATLIMFQKGGLLTPCSKIQFFSDPNQVNLVSEITAGTEGRTVLPPLLLNHGQIWAKVQPGSLALLRREQQLDTQSSLPCAVFQIPKQWTVICWLTETLTSSILQNLSKHSHVLAQEMFQKLIGSMIHFYQESQSPQLIKSQVLNLLSRLIRKLRFIIRWQMNNATNQVNAKVKFNLQNHLDQICITKTFIQSVLIDIETFKKEEEKQANSDRSQEKQILYSSFIQDSIEFLMSAIIPLNKSTTMQSYQDVLELKTSSQKELIEWLDPLMKTSFFIHYFNNEVEYLPNDLLIEIHNQTKLQDHRALDHILQLINVPIDEKIFTKEWMTIQIVNVCNKHHARLINPLRDINFEESEFTDNSKQKDELTLNKKYYQVTVVLDGWNHMTPLPDYKEYLEKQGFAKNQINKIKSKDYRNFIQLYDSDTEDENAGQEKQKQEEKKEEKKVEEEIKPTEWSCDVCTFLNPVSDGACSICGQGRRPPMEVLIAALKQQKIQEGTLVVQEDPKKDEQDSEKQEENVEELIRLKFLAFDFQKIIKVEQKRLYKEQEIQELERLKQMKEKQKQEEQKEEKQKEEKKEEEAASKMQVEEIKKVEEEEKKHEESDAEKSDDDNSQWQDDGNSSDDSNQHSQLMSEADALEKSPKIDKPADLADEEQKDPRMKLIDLGYDIALLDQDPQLAEALLASANFQEEQARLEEQKKKQEEEDKKEEKKRIEKQKQLEEQKKKEMEILKSQGFALKKEPYIKIQVIYGIKNLQEDQNSVRALFKYFSQRITDRESGEISQRMKDVLQDIYQTIKVVQDDEISYVESPYDDQLADYGITLESIKTIEYEEFEQSISVLVAADIVLLFRFLQSQGYDFWLQKRAFPSIRPLNSLQSDRFDKNLIEKLKEFVEINYCQEKKIVSQLMPYQVTLLSKIEDQETVLPKVQENQNTHQAQMHEPQGYFEDKYFYQNAIQQEKNGQKHWYIELSQVQASYDWALIKTFSKYFATTVPFINCSRSIADTPEKTTIPIKLSAYMSTLRNICLSNTKYELKHLILKKTSVERDRAPILYFERLKLHSDGNQVNDNQLKTASQQKGQIDQINNELNGQKEQAKQSERISSKNFMFTQAFEQMRDIDCGMLRPHQPRGADPHLSFEVYFKGEDVVGMGGPYRQFFSDISQELQLIAQNNDKDNQDLNEAENQNGDDFVEEQKDQLQNKSENYLNLLCASRNMVRGSEQGKENFVINPSKINSNDLSLYTFLGILMGVCIRTNTNLSINLPSLVWKQLVGQRLTIEDIEEFDDGIISELQQIIQQENDEEFQNNFGERYFKTTLSDQSVIELVDGGFTKELTFENRALYARKTLYARMKECEKQCEAIKRGICQIIPEALLNIVSYQELEEWIYGKKSIDVELLRRHTEYAKGYNENQSQEIKWFWEILREMGQPERRKFIRFCWAQSTIPPNDEEFDRRQVRFLIRPVAGKGSGENSLDKRLPEADTCFFNFGLPKYSSKEVMKKQILSAITLDNVSLNAEQENVQFEDNFDMKSQDSHESY